MDLGLTEIDISEFYKTVVELDVIYAVSINSYMCTDFCICPGTPSDPWVEEYNQLPQGVFELYKRSKNGFTGEINPQAFADPARAKPLFWTFDVGTKAAKEELVDLSSKSFVECTENVDDIVKKYYEW